MVQSALNNTPLSSLVYITGASSGIGQALAKYYIEQGCRVVLVARRIKELQQWCDQQAFARLSYHILGADVRNVDSIVGAGQKCITTIGLPDIVIASAGISIGIDTQYQSDIEVMRKIYETNNIGMMATFHPFITAMKNRGTGRLVGIASVAGIRGLAGHGAYSSSKAAVISYCESLRLEMRDATGSNGIKVITISPGYIATPLTAKNPYQMPFMLTADQFAKRAAKAIKHNRRYCTIPWQMGFVALIMRAIPNGLYDLLFSGRKRKPRQTP